MFYINKSRKINNLTPMGGVERLFVSTLNVLALSILFTAFLDITSVRAEVCFLPDPADCVQVPYNEYGGSPNPTPTPTPPPSTCPANCFETEDAAKAARTDNLDSYYKNGNCWCLKQECKLSTYNITPQQFAYLNSNWTCNECKATNSKNKGNYSCSCDLSEATGYTIDTENCTKTCTDPCPANHTDGKHYQVDKPGEDKCYSKVESPTCPSTGKECYRLNDTPPCSNGETLSRAGGICTCVAQPEPTEYCQGLPGGISVKESANEFFSGSLDQVTLRDNNQTIKRISAITQLENFVYPIEVDAYFKIKEKTESHTLNGITIERTFHFLEETTKDDPAMKISCHNTIYAHPTTVPDYSGYLYDVGRDQCYGIYEHSSVGLCEINGNITPGNWCDWSSESWDQAQADNELCLAPLTSTSLSDMHYTPTLTFLTKYCLRIIPDEINPDNYTCSIDTKIGGLFDCYGNIGEDGTPSSGNLLNTPIEDFANKKANGIVIDISVKKDVDYVFGYSDTNNALRYHCDRTTLCGNLYLRNNEANDALLSLGKLGAEDIAYCLYFNANYEKSGPDDPVGHFAGFNREMNCYEGIYDDFDSWHISVPMINNYLMARDGAGNFPIKRNGGDPSDVFKDFGTDALAKNKGFIKEEKAPSYLSERNYEYDRSFFAIAVKKEYAKLQQDIMLCFDGKNSNFYNVSIWSCYDDFSCSISGGCNGSCGNWYYNECQERLRVCNESLSACRNELKEIRNSRTMDLFSKLTTMKCIIDHMPFELKTSSQENPNFDWMEACTADELKSYVDDYGYIKDFRLFFPTELMECSKREDAPCCVACYQTYYDKYENLENPSQRKISDIIKEAHDACGYREPALAGCDYEGMNHNAGNTTIDNGYYRFY